MESMDFYMKKKTAILIKRLYYRNMEPRSRYQTGIGIHLYFHINQPSHLFRQRFINLIASTIVFVLSFYYYYLASRILLSNFIVALSLALNYEIYLSIYKHVLLSITDREYLFSLLVNFSWSRISYSMSDGNLQRKLFESRQNSLYSICAVKSIKFEMNFVQVLCLWNFKQTHVAKLTYS